MSERQKKVTFVVSDPILSSIEKAVTESGTSLQAVLTEVLQRGLSAEPEEEATMTAEEAFEMLVSGMRSLSGTASDGSSDDVNGDYLRAASMGLEAMSMLDRSEHRDESGLLSLLLEVLDLVRRGTGYDRLPSPTIMSSKGQAVNIS